MREDRWRRHAAIVVFLAIGLVVVGLLVGLLAGGDEWAAGWTFPDLR